MRGTSRNTTSKTGIVVICMVPDRGMQRIPLHFDESPDPPGR
jgi:hypothetical protein